MSVPKQKNYNLKTFTLSPAHKNQRSRAITTYNTSDIPAPICTQNHVDPIDQINGTDDTSTPSKPIDNNENEDTNPLNKQTHSIADTTNNTPKYNPNITLI